MSYVQKQWCVTPSIFCPIAVKIHLIQLSPWLDKKKHHNDSLGGKTDRKWEKLHNGLHPLLSPILQKMYSIYSWTFKDRGRVFSLQIQCKQCR